MYVCICLGITDSEIKESIESGNNTMEKLKEELRISTGCGLCQKEVESILIETNKCGYTISKDLGLNIIKKY